jgi:RNA-directed DNA polymerase
MKRTGYLFDRICSFEPLRQAALRAARAKRNKNPVALSLQDLEPEILSLENELLTHSYRPRPYRTFRVYEPKERMICAAAFRDRVVHHAICSALEPIFERTLVHDTYACRTDKGPLRAVNRARGFCRRYAYFLKLDVHKYFDSVDHGVLKDQLHRKVKDPDLLWLMDVFIDHPVPWTEAGKAIPIGNLTSQHFANFYLSGLDHFIKEELRIEGYVRYMDDLVLWADEKVTLWDAAHRIEGYLGERLLLQVKSGSLMVAPVHQGLPFLGIRVFPGVVRMARLGWRRFRRKVQARGRALAAGEIDHETWTRSMSSLVGFVKQADTRRLRASFFNRPGALEVQPGDARRQVQQRCGQLPVGDPQQ